MDNFNKKINDEKKAIELENIKLKLKMVSKSSSKPLQQTSVDDYIKNILGSGLKLNRPMKVDSRSVDNVQHNDIIYKHNNFNQSCHLQPQINNGYNSNTDRLQNLPFIYQDVIDTVKLSSTYELDTQKIYEIFLTSGLGQDILGSIWSVINRTSPGKLTREELIVGLAMIATCQEQSVTKGSLNIHVPSWENVISLPDLPVPRINISKPAYTKEYKSQIQPPSQYADNIVADSDGDNFFESNDEWADFTTFHSEEKTVHSVQEKERVEIHNTINYPHAYQHVPSTITQPDTIIPPIIDIYQEIQNQFSDWQDNIHAEKSNTLHNVVIDTKFQGIRIDNESEDNLGHNLPPKENHATFLNITDNDFGDFGDFQIFSTNIVEESDQKSSSSNLDRYELFNCDVKGPYDNLIHQWIRCLTQCLEILFNTVSVLKLVEDELVKVGVFNSDKGNTLLKGIIEVYRVTRNIKFSASKSNILTTSKAMLNLLSELEKYWNEFMLIIPDDMQIDVQTQLSRHSSDNVSDSSPEELSSSNSCGVCLCLLNHDDGFLSHGLHKYHCSCANLWVNTLDLTLPGLTLP